MCPTCPNRWTADLFDALGSSDKASEIRAAGCSWWWSIQYEETDTGQVETRHHCGASILPDLLKRYGSDIAGASKVVAATGAELERDRAEHRQILANLEATVEAVGLPEVLSQLAALGGRAYLAQRLRAAEIEGPQGGKPCPES